MKRFILWLVGMAGLFLIVHFASPHLSGVSEISYFVMISMAWIVFSVAMWIRPVINHVIEPQHGDSREFFIGLIAVAFAIMAFVFYLAATRDWDGLKLGTFGDFIGGTLNPLLTFLTFVGLLFTIILQQRELYVANQAKRGAETALDEEKKRSSRQQFEYTFFQMIALHNDIVNALDLYIRGDEERETPGREVKGRDCFRNFVGNYYVNYRELGEMEDERDRLNKAYNTFWERRNQDLSHYFRYLYNVLRFVAEYQDDVGDRFKYVKLLRAQLSNYELLMLFYTVLHKNGRNYLRYIEQYELFDNLPFDAVLSREHLKYYSIKCYGSQADDVMTYANSEPDPHDY